MQIKPEEISSIIRKQIESFDIDLRVDEVGTVLEVGQLELYGTVLASGSRAQTNPWSLRITGRGTVLARECLFEGGPPDGVGDAVRAYRNGDGGIGHALEPDLRCTASQPMVSLRGLTLGTSASSSPVSIVVGCAEFGSLLLKSARRRMPASPVFSKEISEIA